MRSTAAWATTYSGLAGTGLSGSTHWRIARPDLRRGERSLKARELVFAGRECSVEVIREWRPIDERREVRRDQRRQLRCVAKVRGDVSEKLHDVRVVPLA